MRLDLLAQAMTKAQQMLEADQYKRAEEAREQRKLEQVDLDRSLRERLGLAQIDAANERNRLDEETRRHLGELSNRVRDIASQRTYDVGMARTDATREVGLARVAATERGQDLTAATQRRGQLVQLGLGVQRQGVPFTFEGVEYGAPMAEAQIRLLEKRIDSLGVTDDLNQARTELTQAQAAFDRLRPAFKDRELQLRARDIAWRAKNASERLGLDQHRAYWDLQLKNFGAGVDAFRAQTAAARPMGGGGGEGTRLNVGARLLDIAADLRKAASESLEPEAAAELLERAQAYEEKGNAFLGGAMGPTNPGMTPGGPGFAPQPQPGASQPVPAFSFPAPRPGDTLGLMPFNIPPPQGLPPGYKGPLPGGGVPLPRSGSVTVRKAPKAQPSKPKAQPSKPRPDQGQREAAAAWQGGEPKRGTQERWAWDVAWQAGARGEPWAEGARAQIKERLERLGRYRPQDVRKYSARWRRGREQFQKDLKWFTDRGATREQAIAAIRRNRR
jgi:hypothetical protein